MLKDTTWKQDLVKLSLSLVISVAFANFIHWVGEVNWWISWILALGSAATVEYGAPKQRIIDALINAERNINSLDQQLVTMYRP